MFKTSETTLGSAVATSGTITFSYPANTSSSDFAGYGHKIWVDKFQSLLSSPADFAVTFGASNITVTYSGSTTIPVGARVNAQFNIEGKDNGEVVTRLQDGTINRSALEPAVKVRLGAPDAADADGFVLSQDLTSAGVFSINTDIATALAAGALNGTCDVPRNVVAAWTGNATMTITGTDEYGKAMVEQSSLGTSHTGLKAFKTVTNIEVSADVTSLTVGTGDVLGLPFYVGSAVEVLREYEDGALLARSNDKTYLSGTILEAAVDAGTGFNVVSPINGNIKKLTVISQGSVTTGGDFTVEVGGIAVDGLTVTVDDAAVEGDVDSDTPTAGAATAAVFEESRIEIIPSSGFASAADFNFILEIDATSPNAVNGTLATADDNTATATTGDVRGTYDPTTACDGSTSFDLLVISPDSEYKGVAQYAG